MKKLYYLLPLIVLLVGAGYMVFGHRHAKLTKTPFQHFQDSTDLINLVIETDISNLLAEQEDYEYQPARLTLQKGDYHDEHFHLEVKPRGVFRKANCEFPPLKIRFPDDVLAAGGFMDYPTLKLVTHCQEDLGYDQLILKEYLAFKLYNELTDNSFKAQLVKVKYCDTEKQHQDLERFGFLIEHPRELADRMNGRILGEEFGRLKNINKPAYKIFTVFQYMIGNTDWGLTNRHNVKMIEPKSGNPRLPVPVPYDFDFCGLVDAPYAVPHYSHPISNVKERYFQWRGGEEDFSDVFALFKQKKNVMLGRVSNCEHLESESKKQAMEYLDSFYQLLETPEAIVGGE